MIFAGHRNPSDPFKKQGNIHIFQNKYQHPHKLAELMKKSRVFGKFHS